MKSTRLLSVAVLVILASVVLGCGSGSKSKVQPPQPPDVYVAGFEATSSLYEIAKYWKNGTPVSLGAGTYGSYASSIAVSGSNIYVAGVEGSSSGHDVAKYWLNGSPVELTDGTQEAVAESIFVDGSDIYVAGTEGGVATYWKNGVSMPLNVFDGTNAAEAWSIVVSDGDVYVAGWQYVTTQIDPTHTYTTPVAEYWKNGAVTELSDPLAFGIAHSIFLSGSDIYVAGNTCQENQGPGCDLVTYWKNGTPVVLPGQNPSGGSSIFVSGEDVYVTGNYSTGLDTAIGDLWKDGTLTPLTTVPSAANQVVVSGSDVYVAGASTNGLGQDVAGYFKDGVFAPVTDGTYFASGFAMTVVPQ